MSGNGPLVDSLYARLRSQQESLNVMRADRNNLYEALRELARWHDAGEIIVDGPDAQSFLAALGRARQALERIDKRTW